MSRPHKKLSSKAIAAVNAVEGLHLSPESKARLNELEAKGLSVEAQIIDIREAYKKQTA